MNPPPMEERVEELKDDVARILVESEAVKAFNAKLNATAESIARKKWKTASLQLMAFIKQVSAQAGKLFTLEQAASLQAEAEVLRGELAGML